METSSKVAAMHYIKSERLGSSNAFEWFSIANSLKFCPTFLLNAVLGVISSSIAFEL